MKILLDTNIVLDVLMDRIPFSDAATELFSKVGTPLGSGLTFGYLISNYRHGSGEQVFPLSDVSATVCDISAHGVTGELQVMLIRGS